jgi:hypothetical protein
MITPTEWTRFKFEWLDQVMGDSEVTHAAARIAFWIVQHCNMGTESAWPSIKRLADLANVSNRTVLDAIAQLEAARYLEIQYGRRGRGQSNYYTPILKGAASAPLSDGEKVQPLHLSADETFHGKGSRSARKGFPGAQKGSHSAGKGAAIAPEHLITPSGTPSLNTGALSRTAGESAEQAYKRVRATIDRSIGHAVADGKMPSSESGKRRASLTRLHTKLLAGHIDHTAALASLAEIGRGVPAYKLSAQAVAEQMAMLDSFDRPRTAQVFPFARRA